MRLDECVQKLKSGEKVIYTFPFALNGTIKPGNKCPIVPATYENVISNAIVLAQSYRYARPQFFSVGEVTQITRNANTLFEIIPFNVFEPKIVPLHFILGVVEVPQPKR